MSVPVIPNAAGLSVFGLKLRGLRHKEGSEWRWIQLLLGEKSHCGGPGPETGALCVSVHSQLFFLLGQIHTSSGQPPTHARTPTKKTACFKSGSTIHTGLRPWSPPGEGSRWSRSLDDVVEELHGLHDVFILEGDEELGVSQEADVGSF